MSFQVSGMRMLGCPDDALAAAASGNKCQDIVKM